MYIVPIIVIQQSACFTIIGNNIIIIYMIIGYVTRSIIEISAW